MSFRHQSIEFKEKTMLYSASTHRRLRSLAGAEPKANMITPPRQPLAQLPTPMHRLDRLSDEVGTNIWLKRDDMTDMVASGNKIRKLEYAIGQAIADKADVLVTWGGIQSNHCRATAALAARLGLKSHLLLRGQEPGIADGNLMLDQLLGAEVSYLSLEEYRDMETTYLDLQRRYNERGLTTYAIPVGASDEVGLWGYIDCVDELQEDFARTGIAPDAIISTVGSGGTMAGLILGSALHELDTEIIGFNVCDNESYFRDKISSDFKRWQERYESTIDVAGLPITIIDGYVGPGYAKATPPVFQTISRVAKQEGIVLDPVYTGKAFDAMLQEIGSGRLHGMENIVFIHTGGIYGLFPQKEELLRAI